MGLHYHLKYLVILFVTHVILHCFAVDLARNDFKGLQNGQVMREKDQYLFNNANEEDLYKKNTSPTHSLPLNRKRSQSDLKESNNVKYFYLQTRKTPVSKGSYVSLGPRYLPKSNTPSYIEFDYFNGNQIQGYTSVKSLQRFAPNNGMTKVNHFKTSRTLFFDPAIDSYHHVQVPYMRQEFITTQKALFSKNPHLPLYAYFQPFNNAVIENKGKPKNKVSVRDSISRIPLLGQKAYTEIAYLKSSRVPIRTSMSDSISYKPVLGRRAATINECMKISLKPTRTRMSDSTSNIPELGSKAARVNAYLNSSRVPTRTTIFVKFSRAPTRTSKSDPISNIPVLGRKAATSTKVSTTSDDRVKFFEMYDTNTLKPSRKIKLNESNKIETQLNDFMSEKMEQNSHRNNNLRHWNTNATKIETKNSYKIRRSFKEGTNSAKSNQIQGDDDRKSFPMSIVNDTSMFPSESIFSKSEIMTKTAVAAWSTYPFASVYVYKPTQTHCDAAGISPHWLLAAGSCLSRHTLVNSLHARSAYVTYCGEHWRQPQRIAYVKRSVVHPDFNPRDQVRRLLYNIGLIQVTDSMDACPRWSPVTLMSHQFMTPPGGSVASAVGWGLDRYGTKYMTEKLPHWPLTVYEALIYHDTCPGSTAYSMDKRRDGDGTSNIYCLMLPPYTKEESDPVHGGLLLVEGKLVALYLQEERRPWGRQSAQYTGVWRLLPWVMEVAREPDDGEAAFDV